MADDGFAVSYFDLHSVVFIMNVMTDKGISWRLFWGPYRCDRGDIHRGTGAFKFGFILLGTVLE